MKRRSVVTAGIVCLVLLSGCAGFGGSNGGDDTATSDPTTTRPTEQPETTVATTAGQPATVATTTAGRPETTSEPWSEPEQPNRPFENKLDEEEGNRIESVETVGGAGSGGEGDSSVTLEVTANTSLPNIDPPEHGTVRGEPFLLAYVNASLTNGSQFSRVDGTLLARSDILAHEENGTFTLTVPQRAFAEAGVERGPVEITVLLMDRDSDWDDIYGIETVRVEYSGER